MLRLPQPSSSTWSSAASDASTALRLAWSGIVNAHISPRPRGSVTAWCRAASSCSRASRYSPATAALAMSPSVSMTSRMRRAAHHVDEGAAPGGVDAGGDGEDVVGHLVDPAAGHDAADLGLLAEGDDVGLDAELLVGPGGAGQAAAGLHLVEDEQRVVLVAQRLHRLQELRPEVVVAALALDRLHR